MTHRWNQSLLDGMRHLADPLADQVITDILDLHDLETINRMMRSLVDNDEIVSEHMPAPVLKYLEQTSELPAWADMDAIKRGEKFFDLNWPIVVTCLFCASLPRAYAAWRGAQVLYLTQRMTDHVQRRIFETAQFILDVMAPGGLSPGGKGIRSAQKVRLMHAGIRHYIENVPRWKNQWHSNWGKPINQEDLAGTMLSFSTQILVAMDQFHIPMQREDQEAFLHAWKVAGHIIGVRPELMPADVDDAYALGMTIFNRQEGHSEAGVELTKALLDFMEQQTPGHFFKGFPATTIRTCIGDDVADLLAVPPSDWTKVLLEAEEGVVRLMDEFAHREHRLSKVIDLFSYAVVQDIVELERGGQRPNFNIPDGLRDPNRRFEVTESGEIKMADTKKQKIAILGGGVSAMTAAYELTNVPDWQKRYDITVYQMGWRLGGKGASGRNAQIGQRVEEHGFHFWWGFYDNAFHTIQGCYDEMNRSLQEPLATWEEAFKPFDLTVEYFQFGERWVPYPTVYPSNSKTPGKDLDKPLPTTAEYLVLFLRDLFEGFQTSKLKNMEVKLPAAIRWLTRSRWWRALNLEIERDLGKATVGMGGLLLAVAERIASSEATLNGGRQAEIGYQVIDRLLKIFIDTLWTLVKDDVEHYSDFDTYVTWVAADYACATIRGMINDEILTRGYEVVNHLDYREWLTKNGANYITLKSSLVRGVYDMVFAYEDGMTPNVEAGTALRILLRSLFTYKGGYVWRMEAGMGDTIFTPFYTVLKNRGVNFKFFHRVDNLRLASDGSHIEAIELGRQVNLKNGDEYQPLVNVKGLDCWPTEPLYDQIENGEKLAERISVAGQEIPKYDLESFWTPWEDAESIRLEYQKDFDIIVMGISLGSVPWICRDLLQNEDPKWNKWRNMVDNVKTVQTQAFQLWMKPDSAGLGWPLWKDGLPVMDGYDVANDTVDSWADMSHLINREAWPEDVYLNNISYLVSVLSGPDASELPPPTDHQFPHEQFKRVKENSLRFLRSYMAPVWPNAVLSKGPNGDALDWSLLVDMENREGEDRFNGQFWRCNIDPSERYVLSVAGSSKYRIRTDETGCHNLLVTGDWIKNGADAGFVESAVVSGMQTSQAITRRLLGQQFPENIYGWPNAA